MASIVEENSWGWDCSRYWELALAPADGKDILDKSRGMEVDIAVVYRLWVRLRHRESSGVAGRSSSQVVEGGSRSRKGLMEAEARHNLSHQERKVNDES